MSKERRGWGERGGEVGLGHLAGREVRVEENRRFLAVEHGRVRQRHLRDAPVGPRVNNLLFRRFPRGPAQQQPPEEAHLGAADAVAVVEDREAFRAVADGERAHRGVGQREDLHEGDT